MRLPCPLCLQTGRPELSVRDPHSREAFSIAECDECHVLYVEDPPPESDIGRYYENETGATMHTRPGKLFSTLRQISISRELRPLLERLGPGSRIVDFGSGDGAVSRQCTVEGLRVQAVDVYPPDSWAYPAIPYRQHRMSSTHLDKSVLMCDGEIADAVILRHVLEHVYGPRELLEFFRASGVRYVFVIVPNAASRFARPLGETWAYWDPPRHLTHFTPDALRKLGKESGYDVALLRTQGLDEFVTAAHRRLLLNNGAERGRGSDLLIRVLQPKGMLAGLSSAASSVVTNTVCQVLFEAAPPAR